MIADLAQQFYGFEGKTALTVFIIGFCALGLLAASVLRLNLLILVLAAMFFFSALTPSLGPGGLSYLPTWILPVQSRRAELYLLCGVGLSLLLIGTGRYNILALPVQGWFILVVGVYAGLLQCIHQGADVGVQSVFYALATTPAAAIAARSTTKNFDGAMRLIRAFMFVSVVWAVCCSIQFVINPTLLVNRAGRFWGMLGNAQQAAILCAPWAVVGIWLLLNDPQKRNKPLWIGLIGVNLLFTAWTGSRTGVVVFTLGAMFVLYSRAGRAVLLLPVAAVMLVGLYLLAQELEIMSNVERLVSTENTRGHVWNSQIRQALEHPIIGVGLHETGGSENSYLYAFAAYGFPMGFLVLTLLAVTGLMMLSLIARKRNLPREQRPLVDLLVSVNAMYFGGAVFEGYVLARNSTTLMMLMIFAGITANVAAWVRAGDGAEDEAVADPDLAYDAYAYGHPDEAYADYPGAARA